MDGSGETERESILEMLWFSLQFYLMQTISVEEYLYFLDADMMPRNVLFIRLLF